jgi:hypothetical protein
VAALAVFVAISRQQAVSHSRHIALTLIALLAISSVVVTHHLTLLCPGDFLDPGIHSLPDCCPLWKEPGKLVGTGLVQCRGGFYLAGLCCHAGNWLPVPIFNEAFGSLIR